MFIIARCPSSIQLTCTKKKNFSRESPAKASALFEHYGEKRFERRKGEVVFFLCVWYNVYDFYHEVIP